MWVGLLTDRINNKLEKSNIINEHALNREPVPLRWLNWICWGWYQPRFSINYVGMSKDVEKRLPQLSYIKMKISYDVGLLQSESPWQRNNAIAFFIYLCVSLCREFFYEIA